MVTTVRISRGALKNRRMKTNSDDRTHNQGRQQSHAEASAYGKPRVEDQENRE